MLVKALIIISAFLFMEFMAWFVHKYIMHGILWIWHESHHQPHKHSEEKGFFEKNDLFFLVFAIPGALSFMLGSIYPQLWFLFQVGIGISIYGLVYFLVHDVYIHQRFKWFKILNNGYSRAICKAHHAHHRHLEKEDGESFGLLIVAKRYWMSKK